MGNRYIIKQEAVTPTGGSDILTIIPPGSRRGRLVSVSVNGNGNTSATQQILIGRSTAGTTPSATLTPSKYDHTQQPAAVFGYSTGWAVQPGIATHTEALGFNALGGANRYIPPKGSAFEIGVSTTECISLRASTVATWQAMTLTAIFDED